MAAKNSTPSTEAAREIFGEHPEDVISPMDTAAETLGWLEEIFRVIKEEADAGKANSERVRRLAEAGAYLASDISNYVDGRYETIRNHLRVAGLAKLN